MRAAYVPAKEGRVLVHGGNNVASAEKIMSFDFEWVQRLLKANPRAGQLYMTLMFQAEEGSSFNRVEAGKLINWMVDHEYMTAADAAYALTERVPSLPIENPIIAMMDNVRASVLS